MATGIVSKARIRGKSKRTPIDPVVKPARKSKTKRRSASAVIGSFYTEMGIPRPPSYLSDAYMDDEDWRAHMQSSYSSYYKSWQDRVIDDATAALTAVKQEK